MTWSGGGNAGDAKYYGNFVLGRIALREGPSRRRRKISFESGQDKGVACARKLWPEHDARPRVAGKGGNQCAVEILRGMPQFLDFFSQRRKVGHLDQGSEEEGKIPDFGANLNY